MDNPCQHWNLSPPVPYLRSALNNIMRNFLLCLLIWSSSTATWAQSQAIRVSRPVADRGNFNPDLQPFYHGVASGDPTASSVIIWTRITPQDNQAAIIGTYLVATDTAFVNLVTSGSFTALAAEDYTVKIDLTGLTAGMIYYYYFQALGANSLIGRAKTCPESTAITNLKFAVVSCANYEAGFFNAYGAVAERNDLDAVIHLGDYIYEYGTGTYGLPDRVNEPPNEIITLADYRTRYSLYRLDADLIRLHQQHTFINVWDDHESANGSYTDGADNHQANEGSWEARKAISKRVYFEWMPIRDNANSTVYRKISYGGLCDLLMLDTRLEGRGPTPPHFDTPDVPPRHIISDTQYNWLIDHLKQSSARWKVLGNQVLFSTYNVGFIAGPVGLLSITAIRAAEDQFAGHWESFPTQRNGLIDSLQQLNIDNVVIISGDSHSSWSFDVTKEAVRYPFTSNHLPKPNPYNVITGAGYDPDTGAGSWAVEFATPSISSTNYDETAGNLVAGQVEIAMNRPTTIFNVNYNPHLKYVDLDRHGYFLLDLTTDKAQADYYYVPTVTAPADGSTFGKAMLTLQAQNHLQTGTTPAAPKPVQDAPSPLAPLPFFSGADLPASPVTVFSCHPNPTAGDVYLQLGFQEKTLAGINVYDLVGKRVLSAVPRQEFDPGVYNLSINMAVLPAGVYLLYVESQGEALAVRRIVVGK